jgi:hypothetical protein
VRKLLPYRGHKAGRKFQPTPPHVRQALVFFKILRVDHEIAHFDLTTMTKKKMKYYEDLP